MKRAATGFTLFAAATALLPGSASAQQSPELPVATAQPAPFFYKGKGPGRGNSYVERYRQIRGLAHHHRIDMKM
jgi:hypothetical protein